MAIPIGEEERRIMSHIPERDRPYIESIVIGYPLSLMDAVQFYEASLGKLHLVQRGAEYIASGVGIYAICASLNARAKGEIQKERWKKAHQKRVIRV